MGTSYYENLCKEKGIKLPFYVKAVRDADKVAARKRKILRKRLMGEMK